MVSAPRIMKAAFITSCIGEHESTLHVVTPSELMESRAKLYGVFHASGCEDFDKQVEHRQDPCYAGCAEAKIVSDGVPSRGALRGLHPKICFAGEGGTKSFASWTDLNNTTVTI